MAEAVDHPGHYVGDVECIEAMVQTQGRAAVIDFCTCNAFKYLWRWRRKGGGDDLKKARWYLDYAVQTMGQMPGHDTAERINAMLDAMGKKTT